MRNECIYFEQRSVKRAPELVPLSREHHEALVLARRACEPQRMGAEPATLRRLVEDADDPGAIVVTAAG